MGKTLPGKKRDQTEVCACHGTFWMQRIPATRPPLLAGSFQALTSLTELLISFFIYFFFCTPYVSFPFFQSI